MSNEVASILCQGLPDIVPQALAEAWRTRKAPHAARVLGATDALDNMQDIRLLLLGPRDSRLGDLRAAGVKAPALWLGAAPEAADVTEILPMPVRLGSLLERIDHYLNTAQTRHREPVDCGPYRFDLRDRKLRAAAMEQSLTDKEAAILDLLLDGMIPRAREDLLRDIWGYDDAIDTHTLETHIYRLRRKLADLGGAVDIVTAEGGYCLHIVTA